MLLSWLLFEQIKADEGNTDISDVDDIHEKSEGDESDPDDMKDDEFDTDGDNHDTFARPKQSKWPRKLTRGRSTRKLPWWT